MPFRLLGLAMDPSQSSEVCGQAFARYRAAGVEITILCVAALGWDAERARREMAEAPVTDIVLFEYHPDELGSAVTRNAVGDVMRALRPHVVVAADGSQDLNALARNAFAEARRQQGGSSALPGKLYIRSPAAPATTLTTAVSVPGGTEAFIREYPQPWVTGIVERDLFAGLQPATSAAERRAA